MLRTGEVLGIGGGDALDDLGHRLGRRLRRCDRTRQRALAAERLRRRRRLGGGLARGPRPRQRPGARRDRDAGTGQLAEVQHHVAVPAGGEIEVAGRHAERLRRERRRRGRQRGRRAHRRANRRRRGARDRQHRRLRDRSGRRRLGEADARLRHGLVDERPGRDDRLGALGPEERGDDRDRRREAGRRRCRPRQGRQPAARRAPARDAESGRRGEAVEAARTANHLRQETDAGEHPADLEQGLAPGGGERRGAVAAPPAHRQRHLAGGHAERPGGELARLPATGPGCSRRETPPVAPDLAVRQDDGEPAAGGVDRAGEAAEVVDEGRMVGRGEPDHAGNVAAEERDLRIAQMEPEIRPAERTAAHACPDLCRVFVIASVAEFVPPIQ